MGNNLDPRVVEGFGCEWQRFSKISNAEMQPIFHSYFRIFPWESLPPGSVGFDLGCGTGRWARFVAPRVGTLHCIDPSDAIEVARANLEDFANCRFHRTGVTDIPLEDGSADFGYSLGVLHHLPDTAAGIKSCVQKLKPGAPFLLYLYYRFDNRPAWFRVLWQISNIARLVIAKLPQQPKTVLSEIIAMFLYWPMARLARVLEMLGTNVTNFPLSAYRNKSFYVIRTDSLDRFGTILERRFTRDEIAEMMNSAGLDNIRFSDELPYWCAVGTRQ